MKSPAILSFVLAAVAGCSPVPQPVAQTASATTLRCLSLQQVAGRRVLPDGSLLFETVGPVNYRNRLVSQCPGAVRLGTSATVSIASGAEDGRLCRGDRVRIADPVETAGASLAAIPTCILADFEPVPTR